jgi:hypothetical protein
MPLFYDSLQIFPGMTDEIIPLIAYDFFRTAITFATFHPLNQLFIYRHPNIFFLAEY